jgi:hypothetical protein
LDKLVTVSVFPASTANLSFTTKATFL